MAKAVKKKLLILGMGNPIVGDDGIGIHVSEKLAAAIPPEHGDQVDVEHTFESYMVLLDYMDRYDRIVIVDAMRDDTCAIGRLRVFDVQCDAAAVRTLSSHGVGLESVLALASKAAHGSPARVSVYAVNIGPPTDFHEGLSPQVQCAADRLVERILLDLPLLAHRNPFHPAIVHYESVMGRT